MVEIEVITSTTRPSVEGGETEYRRLMRAVLDAGDARLAGERALSGLKLAENAAWRAFHSFNARHAS